MQLGNCGLLLFACLALVSSLWSPATTSSAQEPAPLILVDEPRLDARLINIQSRQLMFQTASGTRQLQFDQVVGWGWWRDSARGPQMVLQDGSLLVGVPSAIRANALQVATELFGSLTLPRAVVAGMIFRPPTEVVDRDRVLRRLSDNRSARDCVWMFNGDELDGLAVSAGDGDSVTTLRIGQSNTVAEIENVVAVVCPRSELQSQPPSATALWIGLRDGTRLAVTQLVQTESRVDLRLRSGVSISVAASELWPQITWVQPVPAKFTFLSDQPTAGFRHIPFLTMSWNLGIDQNVLGGGLRSAGHAYAKGLGMHCAARSTYNLAQRFRSFEADLALDDAAQGRGSVVFRVFLDRAATGQPPQWKLEYESPVIRGGTAPRPIRVDVSGAERLALVVDFADRGDECDYANWLLARLLP